MRALLSFLCGVLLGSALVVTPTSLRAEASSLGVATTRTADAQLQRQIATAILFNRHLNPFEIKVEVERGIARLRGQVNDPADIDLAELVAGDVVGVLGVDNQLRVQPGAHPETLGGVDAALTAAVSARLRSNPLTEGLQVEAHEGRVILSGSVRDAAQRRLATRLAMQAEGVDAINNRIEVDQPAGRNPRQPPADPLKDSWITSLVKSALLLSNQVNGFDLSVETRRGVVYLGGVADSPWQRDLAVSIASDVPWVRRVDARAVVIRAA